MKLIAQVKLQPTPEQSDLLKKTLEQANAAANFASELAWKSANVIAFKQGASTPECLDQAMEGVLDSGKERSRME